MPSNFISSPRSRRKVRYTARCVAGVLGLCGIPTRLPDGTPLPKGGNALRAVAKEAVHKVYEHGSGRARSEFREERAELARRFRAKYGSGETQANAVPYFVGVFDTVAALGTSGLRRLIMNAILIAGAATIIAGLSIAVGSLMGTSFWSTFAVTSVAGALIAAFAIARARLKVITDFPNSGQRRFHWSGWKFRFYDTYLNPRIRFARHALAIDETRTDFDRVLWGQVRQEAAPARGEGEPEPFIQLWFAGNHSDIGGSYSEDESRLSDIALEWMIEQATALPAPIHLDHTRLRLFPRANGMQHCEAEAFFDRYPAWFPKWARKGWSTRPRTIPPGAPLHMTVMDRFALPAITQCSRRVPYRPPSLHNDDRFSQFYAKATTLSTANGS